MKHTTLSTVLLALLASSLFIAASFNGVGINLINLTASSLILFIIAGIVIIRNLQQHPTIPVRFPEIIAIIWIAWSFCTYFWSQSPLSTFYNAWVISAFPFAFLLWGGLKPWINEKHIQLLLLSIICFYAIWAIAEFLQTAQSTHGPMFYQGNFAALFAAGLLPANAGYFMARNKNNQHLSILLTVILALALFSTYSRGAMLSYFFTLPVLIYLAYRKSSLTQQKLFTLAIVIISSFLFIYFYARLMGGQNMADKISPTQNAFAVGSSHARLMLWESMLDMIKDYPLLGSGVASFVVMYPQYRNPAEDSGGFYGHNDYLQFLHEGGPILLLCLLLSLLFIAQILWRQRESTQPDSLTISANVLAAATFFIHAAADFIFYTLPLALLAGFYLSLAYHQQAKFNNLFIIHLTEPKLISTITVLTFSLAWGFLAINTYISRSLEYQADLLGVHQNDVSADAETILFYHHLSPKHPSPLIRLSELYHFMVINGETAEEKQHALQPALNYNLKLLQQTPRTSHFYLQLAELLQNFPQIETELLQRLPERLLPPGTESLQLRLLKRAQQVEPYSEAANIALALYYQQHQQTKQALAVLKQATRWFNTPKSQARSEDPLKRWQLQQLIKHQILTLQQKTNHAHLSSNS